MSTEVLYITSRQFIEIVQECNRIAAERSRMTPLERRRRCSPRVRFPIVEPYIAAAYVPKVPSAKRTKVLDVDFIPVGVPNSIDRVGYVFDNPICIFDD